MTKERLKALHNGEHMKFATDVQQLLAEAAQPLLAALTAQHLALTQQEDAAFKKISKSAHTERLKLLDDERDRLLTGARYHVLSCTCKPGDDMKEAARLCLIVLDTYGNMARLNYQEETASITNFLADFAKQPYKDAADMVQLNEWLSWIAAANTEFDTVYNTRRDDDAAATAIAMRVARTAHDLLYMDDIKPAIAGLLKVSPTDGLRTLDSKLRTTEERLELILAQRRGRNNADEDPTEDNPTAPPVDNDTPPM